MKVYFGIIFVLLLAVFIFGAITDGNASVKVSRFSVTSVAPSAKAPIKPKAAVATGCPSVRVNATIDGKVVSMCVQDQKFRYTAGINTIVAATMPDLLFKNSFDKK